MAVLKEMFSAMSEVIGPAVILGGVGFALLIPAELITPGNLLQWLAREATANPGILVALIWFLLLTALWQASAVVGLRNDLERTQRRLSRLEPDDD